MGVTNPLQKVQRRPKQHAGPVLRAEPHRPLLVNCLEEKRKNRRTSEPYGNWVTKLT